MKKLLSLFLFSALLTFCPQTMEGKSKSAKKPKKEKVQKFKTEDIYLFARRSDGISRDAAPKKPVQRSDETTPDHHRICHSYLHGLLWKFLRKSQ